MSLLIVIKLGKGNLNIGFPSLSVQLWEADNPTPIQLIGSLPPDPELSQLYQRWLTLYKALCVGLFSRRSLIKPIIEFDEDDLTHVSKPELDQLSHQLQEQINLWLESIAFSRIERQIRSLIHINSEIRVIIETEDQQLQRLPWHLWNFFEDYPQAEVALSPPEYRHIKSPQFKHKDKVKILAILGNSHGIDVKEDKIKLNQLPDSEIVFLVEPKRRELDRWLWDEQGWDILFFAGHSSTHEKEGIGYLEINSNDTITIPQLKNALKTAISRGLKLAIFNSCDGLGLAQQLADLYIPQTIVMRESVPDLIAQEFLKHFLTAFSGGKSFYLAVREARERLQGLEDEFPCASWLPLICQNPTEGSLTWQQLRNNHHSRPKTSYSRPRFYQLLRVSMAVTLCVMGIRWLGLLQTWELKAFDHLMIKRPAEKADQRLLIIGADEEDIRSDRYGYPLSDEVLIQLLNKLKQYQPSVIGIDIFRDRGVPENNFSGHQALINYLQQNQNIVTICAFGQDLSQSIAPLSSISPQQVGFVNLFDDHQLTSDGDDTVRRYLLSRSPNQLEKLSRCTTLYSFAWLLAYQYFKRKDISVKPVEQNWQFDSIIFKPLEKRSGGYQNLDARGNQLLINYRNTPQIAQHLTVRDVLEGNDYFNPSWVKDRVVLIGITASSVPDFHDTIYGEIQGIDIHAHVISQILGAVEDNRPLLWWLSQWEDFLWVGFWSLTGGIIIWRVQTPLRQTLAISISIIFLYGICWFVLINGGWLPLVPSGLASIVTGGCIRFCCKK